MLTSRSWFILSEAEVQTILDMIGHLELVRQTDKLGAYLYKLCQNA